MRNFCAQVLSGSVAGDVTGTALNANQWVSASFQFYFSGSDAAGTCKLQASNDLTSPTHWVDIPNQSTAITSAGSALLTITNSTYQWIRPIYTHTSGTGTVTANCNALSI